MRANGEKGNILRLGKNKKRWRSKNRNERRRKKQNLSSLALLQTPPALGATSSLRDASSPVSFPPRHSQQSENHCWRDQQQSLSIRPPSDAGGASATREEGRGANTPLIVRAIREKMNLTSHHVCCSQAGNVRVLLGDCCRP